MDKNLRTIRWTGIFMLAIGIVLVAATYNAVAVTSNLVFAYISLLGGGMALVFVTRRADKAFENLHKVEQSIDQKVPPSQIVITITNEGVNIQANNMDFNDMIAILEISKLQLINQSISSQKTIEIVKKK